MGRFVVAAVDDFVDTRKDRFFARVKLLHQLERFLVANHVLEASLQAVASSRQYHAAKKDF